MCVRASSLSPSLFDLVLSHAVRSLAQTFFVAIRGRGERVHAKVIDNGDGTYAVGYRPVTSGRYTVAISLGGEPLAGSPFTAFVSAPMACAPYCIVRGTGLTEGMARREETFEILFKDPTGQTAHAEDLDVYVLPVTRAAAGAHERGGGERERGGGGGDRGGGEEGGPHQSVEEAAAPKRSSNTARAGGGADGGADSSPPGSPSSPQEGAAGGAPRQRPPGSPGFIPLLGRRECLVTSKKPLVVRATPETGSERLGTLQPGQRVLILEVRDVTEADGSACTRGMVSLCGVEPVTRPAGSPQMSGVAGTVGGGGGETNGGGAAAAAASLFHAPLEPGADWRDYSAVRPRFLDGIPTPRSPKRSARNTPRFKAPSGASVGSSSARTPARSGGGGAAGCGHSGGGGAVSDRSGEGGRRRGLGHGFGQPSSSSGSSSTPVLEGAFGALPSSTATRGDTSSTRGMMLPPFTTPTAPESGIGSGAERPITSSSPFHAKEVRLPAQPGQAVGWITIHKGDRELVTPRGTLRAGERQRHIMQWQRRLAVDRSLAVMGGPLGGVKAAGGGGALKKSASLTDDDAGKKKKNVDVSTVRGGSSIYSNELAADAKRIGFAYGGVDPGRLHAHGQLVEVHKVHYSIAMTGTYRLYVALRHDGVQLPGSPFLLTVVAGPASALSTALPTESLPLQGVVGDDSDAGCRVLLRASDKMGNLCTAGGANVRCEAKRRGPKSADADDEVVVNSRVNDRGDGYYELYFAGLVAGTFEAHVTIDGRDVLGTPTPLRLLPETIDPSQLEVSGSALSKAVAGQPSSLVVKCKDRYGNLAPSDGELSFEMAILTAIEEESTGSRKKDKGGKDKGGGGGGDQRWLTAPPHPIKGQWRGEEFEMRYTIEIAGNLEMHLWAIDKPGGKQFLEKEGERIQMPGSPFFIHCAAGKANPSGSSVRGFTRIKEVEEPRAGMKASGNGLRETLKPRRNKEREAKSSYDDSIDIFAGDALSVRPQIRDRLGNPTAALDGDLKIELRLPLPEGASGTAPKVELKPSVAVRGGLTNYDVRYEPQAAGLYQMFVCLGGAPIEGSPVEFECVASLPDVARCTYEIPPDDRLFAQKNYELLVKAFDRCGNRLDHGGATVTGRLQSANLPAQQEPNLEVIDEDDGTYRVLINLRAPCELKVIISIDKELHPRGGEFTPFPLTFAPPEGSGNARMKKATEAVKQSLPEKEKKERSAAELASMAVDAFAEKAKEKERREREAPAKEEGSLPAGNFSDAEPVDANSSRGSIANSDGGGSSLSGAEPATAEPAAARQMASRFAAAAKGSHKGGGGAKGNDSPKASTPGSARAAAVTTTAAAATPSVATPKGTPRKGRKGSPSPRASKEGGNPLSTPEVKKAVSFNAKPDM